MQTEPRIDSWMEKLERLFQADRDAALTRRRRRFREETPPQGTLLLWGCGPLGSHIAKTLRGSDLKVAGFIDRNPELWGKTFEGYPVLSPEALGMEEHRPALVVIGIYTSEPLRKLLSEQGVSHLTFPELAWGRPDLFLPHQCLDRPDVFYSQAEEVRRGLALWADEASREEYLGQLEWRLTLNYDRLPPHWSAKDTYFPGDLVDLRPDEHFVDCGAFDGDSIRELTKRTDGRFERITAVEPDPRNYERLVAYGRSASLDPERVRLIGAAIGDQAMIGYLNPTGTVGSSMSAAGAETSIETLDRVLEGQVPTYLKMDIEGYEPQALRGAAAMIRKHRPVLAICLYHAFDHLWSIPNYLHSLVPDYRFHLARHADECWESVCYAIPASRSKSTP